MKLLQNLFDFERRETAGEILFYRFFELFMGYQVLKYAWIWGKDMLLQQEVILPLGIANLIDVSFLFNHSLSLVNAALISLLFVAGYLRWTRWGYMGALLLLHLQYAARFSLGEISHGSNFVGTALLAMGVATLVFREAPYIRRAALGLCYFFFGLGYTTAAFSKLIGTGPHWVDGRHLWMWINERAVDVYSSTGLFEINALQSLALDWQWLATIILVFGLVTELFGFTMWFRKARPYIVTLLIGMHFGIQWTMRITFTSNLILLILLGYPWRLLLNRLLEKLDEAKQTRIEQLTRKMA